MNEHDKPVADEDKPVADPKLLDIDNMTDEEFEAYERTTLMAPDDMAEEMMELMTFVRGDVMQKGLVLPRFGLLSMKARRTPMYCYGHPKLKERFPKSFNDGKHIFVSDDYMRVLLDAETRELKAFVAKEKAHPGSTKGRQPKEGMVPLLLHHLLHMVMNHHRRFKGFPPEIAAIGADISVYSKLRLAFPDMEWLPELDEAFPASKLTQSDLKKYSKLSEDSIIREVAGRYRAVLPSPDELMDQEEQDEQDQAEADAAKEAPKAQKSKDKKAKKSKPNEGGQDDDSADDSEETDEDAPDADDADADGAEKKSKKAKKSKKVKEPGKPSGEASDGQDDDESQDDAENEEGAEPPEMDKDAMADALEQMGMKLSKAQKEALEGDVDTVDMKAMSSVVQEDGLDATKARLEIPDAWDYDKIEALEKNTRAADVDDIAKSVRMAGKAGTMGGGHLEGAAHDEVLKETEGKLSWKLGLQEILGDSMKFVYSEAEAGELFYIDPKEMGLNTEIYVGTELPHKTEGVVMVLMDTSGSITEPLFKMFLSEIFGIIRNENPESSKASEVVLLFCDDVLRGDPILITEDNYEELSQGKLKAYGRGGNDIGGTIRSAAKLPLFEEKKINAIVYFTDLGDAPPTKKDVPEGVPLAFVCPPDYYQEEFIRAVKDFARVFPIEEGLEVDLTRDGYMADPSQKVKTSKKRFGF